MKPPTTIRGRLTLWFAAALAIVLLLMGGAVFLVVRAAMTSEVRARLHEDLAATADFVRDNPGDVAELGEFKPDALLLVLKGGEIELRSAGWERVGLPVALAIEPPDWLWESPSDHHYRIAGQNVVTPERTFVVAVAIDEEPVQQAMATLAWTLGVSVPVVLALSVMGGWVLAGRMLSPVRRMAAAAERIGSERLSERLPVENPADELGRLAVVTNQSLDRLQETMERQRRFTADASHEIRTPLTAIRSVGEVALRRTQSTGDYRETIGTMLEGVGQLTGLVDRLLLLARADAGTVPIKPERFDAGEVARDACELLQPVADQKGVTIDSPAALGLGVTADKMLFRQALLNILDNAIKHSPRGSSVRVEGTAVNGSIIIAVRDHGPGIAPEHQERIFERFYRIEPGRSRGSLAGGAGLGLAIARWAVGISGGRLELQSQPGAGSTLTITLPAESAGEGPTPDSGGQS